MEFLKALEEAKEHGISKEEFAKLWDFELKLKLQKEESRTLELKLACAGQHDTFSLDSFLQRTETILKDHILHQQEQIQELRANLQVQSQIQYQEVAKLLETQAGLIGQVMRNELDRAVCELNAALTGSPLMQPTPIVNQCYTLPQVNPGFVNSQLENNKGSLDAQSTKHVSSPVNSHQTKKPQPKKNKTPKPGKPGALDVSLDYCLAWKDEAEFVISDAEQFSLSGSCYNTPFYLLEDCPCKVRLCLWFGNKSVLNIYLSVAGLYDEPLPVARKFSSVGFIKNKNSGAFSQLFDIVSPPFRRLKSSKDMQALGSTCLKTSGGTFKDVTFQELEDRGFIINDTIVIKWVCDSFEDN